MGKRLWHLFKREYVMVIAGLAALVTMFIIPPSAAYRDYFDLRVLILLFALMTVVSGFRRAGVLQNLAAVLQRRIKTTRGAVTCLVLLCFFASMAVTNDVALLSFVPLAILVLQGENGRKYLIYTVVLQAIAANLGSMLTPVGNPQNLYLFSFYELSPGAFFAITAPVTIFSLLLLCLAVLPVKKLPLSLAGSREALPPIGRKKLILYGFLFIICLLSVFRVIEVDLLFAIILFFVLLFDRDVMGQVDYGLLLTFVFFFIFVGNLGQMEDIRSFLTGLLSGQELWASAAVSQVISNVPAAALLAPFTENAQALLLGVNIGGLGTPVASLASLIALRLYGKAKDAKTGRFLLAFLCVNILFLGALLLFAKLWYPGL